jgi:hypothetical protein
MDLRVEQDLEWDPTRIVFTDLFVKYLDANGWPVTSMESEDGCLTCEYEATNSIAGESGFSVANMLLGSLLGDLDRAFVSKERALVDGHVVVIEGTTNPFRGLQLDYQVEINSRRAAVRAQASLPGLLGSLRQPLTAPMELIMRSMLGRTLARMEEQM